MARKHSTILRMMLFVVVCLAIPIVPFLFFHESIESAVNRFVESPPSQGMVFGVTIALLSTDVLLPIPSSFVSTLAGGLLPIPWALAASWIGLTLGAVIGFELGRRFGTPLANKLASEATMEQIQPIFEKYGGVILVVTRPLPILAEATVLLISANRLPWKKFLPPVALSNLGIAIAYSVLGDVAAQNEMLTVALAISVALPLLIASAVKSWVTTRTKPDPQNLRP